MQKQDPIPLGEVLREFIEKRQLAAGAIEGRAKEVWRQVAGEYVASFTEEVFLRNGVLNIRVNSAVVKNEIHIRRRHYIELMNEALGGAAGGRSVRAIIIR